MRAKAKELPYLEKGPFGSKRNALPGKKALGIEHENGTQHPAVAADTNGNLSSQGGHQSCAQATRAELVPSTWAAVHHETGRSNAEPGDVWWHLSDVCFC